MKKLLLALIVLGSLSSAKITGPEHVVTGNLGAEVLGATAAISYMPEWKVQINNDFDITFGPQISLITSSGVVTTGTTYVNLALNLSLESDFNFKVSDKTKVYVGLEAGAGVGPFIMIYENNAGVAALPIGVGKLSVGAKFNSGLKVGGYLGYGKGVAGLEVGYKF